MRLISIGLIFVGLYCLFGDVRASDLREWSACYGGTGNDGCQNGLKSKAAAEEVIFQHVPRPHLLKESVPIVTRGSSAKYEYASELVSAELTEILYASRTEIGDHLLYPTEWTGYDGALGLLTQYANSLSCEPAEFLRLGEWVLNPPIKIDKEAPIFQKGQVVWYTYNANAYYRIYSKDANGLCNKHRDRDIGFMYRAQTAYCGDVDYLISSETYPKGPGDLDKVKCRYKSRGHVTGRLQVCPDITCEERAGNPINISTGEKEYSQTDGQVDGVDFVRKYLSYSRSAPDYFSKNWAHNYSSYLSPGKYYLDTAGNQWQMSGLSVEYDPRIKVEEIDGGYEVNFRGIYKEQFDENGYLSARLYPDGRNWLVTRLPNGKISAIVSSSGRKIRFFYNDIDQISEIDFSGVLVRYGYDSFGRLSDASYADGYRLNYEYDDVHRNNLTKVSDNFYGEVASYAYDVEGRAISTASANGADEYNVAHDYDSDSVKVTGPNNNLSLASLTYSGGAYRVSSTSYTDPSSGAVVSSAWKWDDGFLYEKTKDGTTTRYTRDSYTDRESRRATYRTGSSYTLRAVETEWHESIPLPTETRVYGMYNEFFLKNNWSYNSRGQVVVASTSNADASHVRVETRAYCEAEDVVDPASNCPVIGLLRRIDYPRNDVADVVSYRYYPADHVSCSTPSTTCDYRKGDLWKVIDALGHVTENLRYDSVGRVLSVRDANGIITDFDYHVRGWLVARKVRGADAASEGDDLVTRIEYHPSGLVHEVTEPDGAFTRYHYDAAHRLTRIEDEAGNTITYTLDNAGNRIAEETHDVNGVLRQTLSRVFNQLGQLETQADANYNPTDYTYDANGNVATVTDALGRVAAHEYGALGRLTRTLQDVAGIAAETLFEYDAADRLTKVTDPKGLSTTYTYDGLGNLLKLDSPDTDTTTYMYDSAGNRVTQVDARGQASHYTYDALNRLTGISYDGAAQFNTTYVYDITQPDCGSNEDFSKGRLTAFSDANGSTQYCYGRFGHLVRKVRVTDGRSFVVRYAYEKGKLSRVTYPDGTSVDYARDAHGRVSQVDVTPSGGIGQMLLTDVAYAPFGPIVGWSYGNGRALARVLDLDYRPQSILDSALGGLDVGLSYDPAGNLTRLSTADLAEPPQALFEYDGLNRLTHFRDGASGDVIEQYQYDATGNRIGFSNAHGSQSYSYPVDSHRLASVAGVARDYDAAGNMVAIGGTARTYHYNPAGRMGETKQGSVVTASYGYNGKGEQILRDTPASRTHFVYDESGQLLGQYLADGTPLQQYVWLNGLPVGVIADGQLHYVEPDHLGTPRAVIDPVRNQGVWSWDLRSEAFGNSAPNVDPDHDGTAFVYDLRFPGQRYDSATGLNYNYFRDYEAATGRYVESDLIGQNGGLATYAYSNGNPSITFDFYGLQPVLSDGAVTGERVLGWVSCAKGTLAPMVMDGVVQKLYGDCPGPIRDCVEVHEQSHLSDARRLYPTICTERFWEPAYWRTQHLANSGWGQKGTEFGAHAAQLRCLVSKLRGLDKCDRKCRKTILRAMRDVAGNIPSIAAGGYGVD